MPRTPRGMRAAVPMLSTLLLSSLGLLVLPNPAQATPIVPAAVNDPAMVAEVAAVLHDSRVTKATVGVVVADTANGRELLTKQPAPR